MGRVEPFRLLSLFAGIGGFDLGLERTGGFKTIAFAETDPYASRVLAARWPGVPNLGDVETAEYPDADFICAGFPCQDISFAGEGAGLAGARSGLWREVVRALRMVRPRGALLENVAALLSRGMGTVLGVLAEIGHDAEWHCIPASAVGAPHIRDRVWIYSQPQHPDADSFGPHREATHVDGGAEPAHEQVCLSGPLGALLADAAGQCGDRGRSGAEPPGRCEPPNGGEAVAHPVCGGQPGPGAPRDASDPEAASEGQAAHAEHGGIGHQWSTEPDVGRVANGVPARVDRLRCLGNAVVPQVVELIGRAILQARAA